MALSKKRVSSLRYIDATDGAIDTAASSYDRYIDEGCNAAHLTFIEGEEPTIFVLEPLTFQQRQRCNDLEGREQVLMLVRCGLRNIENFPIEDDAGTITGYIRAPEFKPASGYGKVITQAWLNDADLPDEILNNLGALIWQLSQGSFPLSRPFGAQPGAGQQG